MFQFNEFFFFDRVFYKVDIYGFIIYVKVFYKFNIFFDEEFGEIVNGFQQVEKEWVEGKFVIDVKLDEDIYMVNECCLGEIIGKVVGKLYIGCF